MKNTNNAQELSKEEKKKTYNKAYREANKEKIKASDSIYYTQYYKLNKEKAKSRERLRYEANKEKICLQAKSRYEANREQKKVDREQKKAQQKQQKVDREQKKAQQKVDREQKKAQRSDCRDIYRIKNLLRRAVNRAFVRIKQNKPTDTRSCLGCTYEEAKHHFESLFKEGMSWENYGTFGWHVDHIRPVSSFTQDDLHLMNHISNLQPLWWYDNLSKGNSSPTPSCPE